MITKSLECFKTFIRVVVVVVVASALHLSAISMERGGDLINHFGKMTSGCKLVVFDCVGGLLVVFYVNHYRGIKSSYGTTVVLYYHGGV
jgi:hypothetical protein